MTLLRKQVFACLDCETTGLNAETDEIIEIALALFTFDEILETLETLVDPGVPISASSQQIHHITDEMVQGKPKLAQVLSTFLKKIEPYILIGHGIATDLAFLSQAARKHGIVSRIEQQRSIDTLRMARLYGESPTNSLERLRQHYNIQEEGAHRAMNDVLVNIEVFKSLAASFKTTDQLLDRLKQPIALKTMPLGKYKGRPFSDIPLEYLHWAARQSFDQDLLFSLRTEMQKRRKKDSFLHSNHPFSSL